MSLEENIKKWVVLDNQQKKLNEQVKELRDKKNNLTGSIITDFSDKNIKSPIIKISDGRLNLIETQHANVMSFKFLLDSFKEYFDDEKEANKLLDFVKSKRTFTNVSSIKRIYNKE
jgi:hypothetical protein|tara:strand:- start:729 stop:1076 length:348 start_codon:yes stop_codon:yes gene_type:complete